MKSVIYVHEQPYGPVYHTIIPTSPHNALDLDFKPIGLCIELYLRVFMCLN